METTHILILSSIAITVILGVVTILLTVRRDSQGEGEWKGKIDKNIEHLTKSIDVLTKRINSLFRLVVFDEASDELFASFSPINLTDTGKKILDELAFGSIISTLVPIILRRSKSREPYEIEQVCLYYALEEFEDLLLATDREKYEHLTRVAYNHGIAKESVLRIIGIALREKVLQDIKES